MKIDKEFQNEHASTLINSIFDKLKDENELETIIDDTGGFYKINFRHKNNLKCPFSLWLSIGNGEKIFFNIGHLNEEAIALHFVDITNEIVVYEILDLIYTFLNSSVEQTKLYCRGRIKKTTYTFYESIFLHRYTYLHESYFACFNKKKEIKKFERWTI